MKNFFAVIGKECCGGPPSFVKLMQHKNTSQHEFVRDIESTIEENEFICSVYIVLDDSEILELEF